MRKAALLFNPDSGGRRARRRAQLDSVLAILRAANVEAELLLTESASHGVQEAQQAICDGCDTIFACGGDGTINNIAQVLANTNVALAVLPMGTANALAHDLGLPKNILAAAKAAIGGMPRRVAIGQIRFLDLAGKPGKRLFVVAAGAGVDAHLFYKLYTARKQRLGMAAYYGQAWQLWFNHRLTRFQIDFAESGSGKAHRMEVSELLAVRIRNFGGVLRELAPGASLGRNDVRLICCTTSSRIAYLAYVARAFFGQSWKIPGIDLAYSDRISCSYCQDSPSPAAGVPRSKVYVEADGELLGSLPAEISTVPDALTVIGPRRIV